MPHPSRRTFRRHCFEEVGPHRREKDLIARLECPQERALLLAWTGGISR